MTDTTILKSDFNDAVNTAREAVQPLLRALERSISALGLDPSSDVVTGAAALHSALSDQLSVADEMGSTGGFHTDGGGTGKGDGE